MAEQRDDSFHLDYENWLRNFEQSRGNNTAVVLPSNSHVRVTSTGANSNWVGEGDNFIEAPVVLSMTRATAEWIANLASADYMDSDNDESKEISDDIEDVLARTKEATYGNTKEGDGSKEITRQGGLIKADEIEEYEQDKDGVFIRLKDGTRIHFGKEWPRPFTQSGGELPF